MPSLSQQPHPNTYILLIPVFNDWDALSRLLDELHSQLSEVQVAAEVILVDDASTIALPEKLMEQVSSYRGSDSGLISVNALSLRRNLGHQRAIAVGLAYIAEHKPGLSVVVMDCDGEDRAVDVPQLLDMHQQTAASVVFARRQQRSEAWGFRLGYRVYRSLFALLTGKQMRMGNFSVLSADAVARLVSVSELWNHYVAAILKSGLPYCQVDTDRGQRYAGNSKMNWSALVVHGLSSIAVFADTVGVRALVATLGFIASVVLAMAVVVGIRLTTDLAIPGWASTMFMALSILMMNGLLLSALFLFLVLSGRNQAGFIPIRDYRFFILSVKGLGKSPAASKPPADEASDQGVSSKPGLRLELGSGSGA